MKFGLGTQRDVDDGFLESFHFRNAIGERRRMRDVDARRMSAERLERLNLADGARHVQRLRIVRRIDKIQPHIGIAKQHRAIVAHFFGVVLFCAHDQQLPLELFIHMGRCERTERTRNAAQHHRHARNRLFGGQLLKRPAGIYLLFYLLNHHSRRTVSGIVSINGHPARRALTPIPAGTPGASRAKIR